MENADKSILLQFAKFSKGFRISDFDEFVEESIGVENLDFLGRLAYPNQWQIRLSNPDLRESLIRKGKTRIKNRSCWMYPLNQQEIRGFVHWLPNSVNNDELMEQLKLYGNVLFIESQERNIKGRKIESDPRYYGLILSHGTIKEAIPHFLKINGYLCHLAVRGREPACFHCKEVGHIRAECPKYKAKLTSYCNREPNTAPQRSKPRGRRHVKVETEVKGRTGGDEVSSSADIVRLEKDVPVDEETTELPTLPILEDRERVTEVQEEATSSTEKELAETGVLTERTAKSCIATSAASSSETEREDIIEALQQIQRRTAEDLRQRFQKFGTEVAQTLTREKLSTYARDQMQRTVSEAIGTAINLEPEISKELEKRTKESCAPKETFTRLEKSGEDSDVDTNIKEKKGYEKTPTLPTMHDLEVDIAETREKIPEKSKEMEKDGESTASDIMKYVDLILMQTQQTAIETIIRTFKELREFAKNNEAAEIPTIESATDTQQKLAKGEMQSERALLLGQTKQTASGYIESTFKKVEEEITSLSSQLTNEQTDTDTKLTKDHIQFAYQTLKQTKETVVLILENAFRNLTGQLEKETESAGITTETSAESKPPLKISESSTKSAATFIQRKQDALDIVKHFDKEGMKDAVEADNCEKQSAVDNRQKETVQSESEPGVISQVISKAAKISESSEESKKESETEKVFIASKELESHVSKAIQENNDELQINIRKVFASVFAKDELLPETRAILNQVESEVNEVVEEIKNRR